MTSPAFPPRPLRPPSRRGWAAGGLVLVLLGELAGLWRGTDVGLASALREAGFSFSAGRGHGVGTLLAVFPLAAMAGFVLAETPGGSRRLMFLVTALVLTALWCPVAALWGKFFNPLPAVSGLLITGCGVILHLAAREAAAAAAAAPKVVRMEIRPKGRRPGKKTAPPKSPSPGAPGRKKSRTAFRVAVAAVAARAASKRSSTRALRWARRMCASMIRFRELFYAYGAWTLLSISLHSEQ